MNSRPALGSALLSEMPVDECAQHHTLHWWTVTTNFDFKKDIQLLRTPVFLFD